MKRKNINKIFLIVLPLLSVSYSCTKLNTNVYDKVTNFWQSPDQIAAGVAPAYSGLRGYAPANDIFNLNECSSDEVIVPTRGGDWFDNGLWRDMWKQTWGPEIPFVEGGWQFIYSGVSGINTILEAVNEINPKPVDSISIKAELKTVRAFYYYLGLDLFGNIPIVESNNTDLSKLGNKTRKEVFAFVEKEIKDNLAFLATDVSLKTYGRSTQWFAQAILAKLYLNAEVYTGTSRWTDCIVACDAILNSNNYILEPDFFSNFLIANEGSKENIFVIPFDINAGLNYFWLQGATLHYQSGETFGLDFGGYNGHCSTAEYLSNFDFNDTRRKMFLVGEQYINQIRDSAHIQYESDRNIPLSFDPEITAFSIPAPKDRVAGARCAKWEFNKHSFYGFYGNMSNDFAVFRLADIILMKAEAQYMNGSVSNALSTINQKINGVSIRSRAGLPDFTAAEMNPDGLLKERACELSWEGWRRNDMVRLGHFTDARIPEKSVSGNFRKLYPIPKPELDKNPYLKQNQGY